MERIHIVLIILLITYSCAFGEEYCSKNSKLVECVPCSTICPNKDSSCLYMYFTCPAQCGREQEAKNCKEVCPIHCLNRKCMYTRRRLYIKCKGCIPGFHGQHCHQFCSPGCHKCNQFNGSCITCRNGYFGDDCKNRISTDYMTKTISSSVSTIGYSNCEINCDVCNSESGTCSKCIYEKHGHVCRETCTSCNMTSCLKEGLCRQCKTVTTDNCLQDETKKTSTKKGMQANSFLYIAGVSIFVSLSTLFCICKRRKYCCSKQRTLADRSGPPDSKRRSSIADPQDHRLSVSMSDRYNVIDEVEVTVPANVNNNQRRDSQTFVNELVSAPSNGEGYLTPIQPQ